MSIWAAIAGGAGEYLRQSDMAKEEERIRLKEEALAKLQAEKEAQAEERYLAEQMQKEQDRADKKAKEERDRADTLADRAARGERADKSLRLREDQMKLTAENSAAVRAGTALWRQSQLERESASAEAKRAADEAKKAAKMSEESFNRYKAANEAFTPIVAEAVATDSTLDPEAQLQMLNFLRDDFLAMTSDVTDPIKLDAALKARLAYTAKYKGKTPEFLASLKPKSK